MLSRRLDVLGDGPFARIATLLDGIPPNPSKPVLDLSLGEPRHGFPDFVGDILEENRALLGRYPPLRGTLEFRGAAAGWLTRRYHLHQDFIDPDRHLIILSGSREGLFLIPQVVVPDPGSHTRAAVQALEKKRWSARRFAMCVPRPTPRGPWRGQTIWKA